MTKKYFYIVLLLLAPYILTSKPEWIPLICTLPTPSNIQLLHSDITTTSLLLSLKGFWLNKKITATQGSTYSLQAENTSPIQLKGYPDLIMFTSSIIIPAHGDMKLLISGTKYHEYHDIVLQSSSSDSYRDSVFNNGVTILPNYEKDEFFPGSLASIGEPYLIRDIRGLDVYFYPFQYNPVQKILRVYYEIILDLKYNGSSGRNEYKSIFHHEMTKELNRICSDHFINYNNESGDDSRDDNELTNPKMLIISYGEFIDALQPFIQWKTEKGIKTEVVNVSDIGDSQSIKNFVKKYYEEKGLTYLLLVGDNEYVPSITTEAGLSDNSYGYVSGDDHYLDVFVGRLSAITQEQVSIQVERILRYEKCISSTYSWLDYNIGIGSSLGPGDNNEYDFEHVRNIQNTLQNIFTQKPVELFDGSQGNVDAPGDPSSKMVADAINKGAGIIIYTGIGNVNSWSTSGFSTNDVLQLSNVDMYPIIISAGCGGGNFKLPVCFAEAWLRASIDGQPTGAVAVLMPTGRLGWSPPMYAQDEMIRILINNNSDPVCRTFGGITMEGCISMNSRYGPGVYPMTDVWTIFGDPSMDVFTARPEVMKVSIQPVISVDVTDIAVQCDIENALVSLTFNGQIIGTGCIKNGTAIITFSEKLTPGTLSVTITSFNHRPYITEISVINYPSLVNCIDPQDYQQMVFPNTKLQWDKGIGGKPEYYKIYLGTNNPPSNLLNGQITNDTVYLLKQDLLYDQDYFWRINAYNDFGYSMGDVWHFKIIRPPDENFEVNDFPRAFWGLEGPKSWFIDNNISYRGVKSCHSGKIGDDEYTSLLYYSNNATEDFVSFWIKISSEPKKDKLQFLLDDILQDEWSGEIDWTRHLYKIPPGYHTLEWKYQKDSGGLEGLDGAWLDDVYLPVNSSLVVDAGQDEEICEDEPHHLSGYARNFTNVKWTSTGNGTFDNPYSLTPVYFPVHDDYIRQKIIVTLTGYNKFIFTSVNNSKSLTFSLPPQTLEQIHDTILSLKKVGMMVYDVYSPQITSYIWMPSGATTSFLYLNQVDFVLGPNPMTLKVTTISGCSFIKKACITIANNDDLMDHHSFDLITYPNPNHGVFMLEIQSNEVDFIELSICDIIGNPVYKTDRFMMNYHYSKQIDLSQLAKGIYFVIVKGKHDSHRRKVIIQ